VEEPAAGGGVSVVPVCVGWPVPVPMAVNVAVIVTRLRSCRLLRGCLSLSLPGLLLGLGHAFGLVYGHRSRDVPPRPDQAGAEAVGARQLVELKSALPYGESSRHGSLRRRSIPWGSLGDISMCTYSLDAGRHWSCLVLALDPALATRNTHGER
jgi:hypothetical protein